MTDNGAGRGGGVSGVRAMGRNGRLNCCKLNPGMMSFMEAG